MPQRQADEYTSKCFGMVEAVWLRGEKFLPFLTGFPFTARHVERLNRSNMRA